MDERILARPAHKAHDTRRSYLDKLRTHLAEHQKLINHWQTVGWNSKDQEREYRDYENALIQDVERLDMELIRGAGR